MSSPASSKAKLYKELRQVSSHGWGWLVKGVALCVYARVHPGACPEVRSMGNRSYSPAGPPVGEAGAPEALPGLVGMV